MLGHLGNLYLFTTVNIAVIEPSIQHYFEILFLNVLALSPEVG